MYVGDDEIQLNESFALTSEQLGLFGQRIAIEVLPECIVNGN